MSDEVGFAHDYDSDEILVDPTLTNDPAEAEAAGPDVPAVEDDPPAGFVSREEFEEVAGQFRELVDAYAEQQQQEFAAELAEQLYPDDPAFLDNLVALAGSIADEKVEAALGDVNRHVEEFHRRARDQQDVDRIEQMFTGHGVREVADRSEVWELAQEIRPAVGAELGVSEGQQSQAAAQEAFDRAAKFVAAGRHKPVDELDLARGWDEHQGYSASRARPRFHTSERTKPAPPPKGPYAGMDEVAFARNYQPK